MAFALVGATGTLAHYSILYFLVEYQGFDAVIASGFGALAGLIVNYALNYSLTFNSQQSHVKTFPKFALIASIGLCLNLILMAGLTPKLYYIYAQILTTLLVLIWNFLANSLWTFQADRQSEMQTPMIKKYCSNIGLIALIAMVRLLSLGLYPLVDPSESRYSEMGRKMFETGNWVTPLIDYGVPFWGKPPLAVWMSALSFTLVGINEFSARLPAALLAMALAWLVYHLAKSQRDAENAQTAVIILASSLLFFVMSGSVAMDQSMSFGVGLALVSFWQAVRKNRTVWAYGFFIGLSIGLLAKGPISMVLTGLSLGLWTAITGEWRAVWQRLPWIKGSLLMLCISVPWYLIAEHQTPGFLEYFFIGEHWKRFTESGWKGDLYGSGRAHAHGMIWLYALLAAFPWSLLFLKRLAQALLQNKALDLFRSDDGWRLYCVLWIASPLLFFSLSANIIWTYVLPGLPGLALLLADWRIQFKYKAVLGLVAPVTLIGLCVIYRLPDMDFLNTQKPLVEAYQKQSSPDERLVYLRDAPYSAQFYLQGKSIALPGLTELQERLKNSNDFYIFEADTLNHLPETIKNRMKLIKKYKEFTLYHAIQTEGS